MSGTMKGTTTIVTGAASGIGRATAQRLIGEGGKVIVADINEEAGRACAEQFGASARFIRCDVTDEGSIAALIDDAAGDEDFTALVNCAGMLVHRPFVDLTAELWDKVFAVNTRSAFLTSKHAIPHFGRAGRGSIVNVSSMAGLRGAPGLALYSSSKAAMIGMTVSLALELAAENIRVNAVCPGWIETAFNQPFIDSLGGEQAQAQAVSETIPMKRMGTADEVAAMIVYLAGPQSGFVTAQAMSINGGAYN